MTADSPRHIGRMPNQQNAIAVAVPPVVSSSHPTPYQVASGVAGQAITMLGAGLAVGALCSHGRTSSTRPSPCSRRSWLARPDLTVPNAPPVRQLVNLLNEVYRTILVFSSPPCAETIVISVIFMGVSLRLCASEDQVRQTCRAPWRPWPGWARSSKEGFGLSPNAGHVSRPTEQWAYAATARGPVTPDASAFLARWFIAETCGVPHPKGIHSNGMTASPKP